MGRVETHGGTSLPPPRAVFWFEDVWVLLHEHLLFVRRQAHHGPLEVVMEAGEDPAVDAEVWVAHMGTFNRVRHSQYDSAEIVSGQRS